MTPLLISTPGDDYGPAQIGDFTAGTSAEQVKHVPLVDSGASSRETSVLHGASSRPEEVAEWNLSPWAQLNEAVTPSALRGQLSQLDLHPNLRQDARSEVSESRHLISNRQYEDVVPGMGGLHQYNHLPRTIGRARGYPHHSYVEYTMDMSDGYSRLVDTDENSAAQRFASTVASWDGQRPCRPNPNSSHDMTLFLTAWRMEYELRNVDHHITANVMSIRNLTRPSIISSLDVAEGRCDIQGMTWDRFQTQASDVQQIRRRYHQHPQIRQYPTCHHARVLPISVPIFDFHHTNTEARPWIEHFQLRDLVATTSHNDVHYVSHSKVMSISPSNPTPICVMDLNTSSDPYQAASDFHITALAAAGSALVAGGFRGEYAIQNLMSEYGTEPVAGYVSNDRHAITNHIHTFNSRSHGHALAAFCSNDKYLRTIDIHTSRVTSRVRHDDVMNCSATSPNGRLRVLVGDFEGALIADADSGRLLEHPRSGSQGHGFACAWADNDVHVATSGQDCQVVIWDARNWSSPLAAIATENAYPTSLQFSPVGGGSPVLVVAEAADAVNIVDARTYSSQQTVNFFGDVAGTAISADGSRLTIANGDRHLGGISTFVRRDFGVEVNGHGGSSNGGDGGSRRRVSPSQRSDWLHECELEFHPRVRLDAKARRRRGLRLDNVLF